MLIAQITDLHIDGPGKLVDGRLDTASGLNRAIEHLNSLEPQPELVIATGDLVNDAAPAQYEHLRDLLKRLRAPLFLMPGNHDARAPMREAFPDHRYLAGEGEFMNYAIEDWPVRVVALDSLVPGRVGGALCAARADWLSRCLAAEPKRPTLLCVHHPPFRVGAPSMDEMTFEGVEQLAAIVMRNPQVERLTSGHLHRAVQASFAGTVAAVAPSTAFQFTLDLAGRNLGWTLEPAACLLHHWAPETGIVSHVSFIDRFESV